MFPWSSSLTNCVVLCPLMSLTCVLYGLVSGGACVCMSVEVRDQVSFVLPLLFETRPLTDPETHRFG